VPSRAQLVRIIAAAFAFGLFAAWAKGQNTDGLAALSQLRGDLGNVSTPWLLVPFIAGAQCLRIRTAALVGLLATTAALVGFYLFTTAVVDLGGHGVIGDLRLEFWGNHVYFEGGLLSGPVFGALGGWWRRTKTIPASIVAGVLLMAEPIVLLLDGALGPKNTLANNNGLPLLFRMVGRWTLSGDTSPIAVGVYAAEFMLGLCLVVLVATRRRFATRGA
jgi:Family of unknown function (DUF6518)